MTTFRTAVFFFLTMIVLSPAVWAQACGPASIEGRWIKAIEDQDWDAMTALLATDARYLDFTMAYFDRPAIDLEGPEAITGFWRESSDSTQTADIRYTLRDCFETAGIVALNLRVDVSVSGETWGINTDRVALGGSQTTILVIREGKIVEATDYVDYAGVERQVAALQLIHGALPESE